MAPSPHLTASLNLQRKAALSAGGAVDHAGRVRVTRMRDFDMDRTIFGGIESTVPRLFMQDKLAKEVFWDEAAVQEIERGYNTMRAEQQIPAVDQRLIDFMVNECDFSMEHADGTFLEHLVFCHDYAAIHFPEHSPNVALLHSILGTATNTFAMGPDRIEPLAALLTDFESSQVQAFPSILRLLYDEDLLAELDRNMARLDKLNTVSFRRVIDNEPLELDPEGLWVNLNYHLMHFVDFMPSANWSAHRNDPLLQMFETLSNFLDRAGQRRANVDVTFPTSRALRPRDESPTIIGTIRGLLPADVSLKLARKTIQEYSEKCGHDLSYQLTWS